jgi:hypothetical protein
LLLLRQGKYADALEFAETHLERVPPWWRPELAAVRAVAARALGMTT